MHVKINPYSILVGYIYTSELTGARAITETQSFILLKNIPWHNFDQDQLTVPQTIPKQSSGVWTGQGPLPVGSLDVAILIWKLSKFNSMDLTRPHQLASWPRNEPWQGSVYQ